MARRLSPSLSWEERNRMKMNLFHCRIGVRRAEIMLGMFAVAFVVISIIAAGVVLYVK